MHDLTALPHGRTVFTKIDLVRPYHQIQVAIENVEKTVVSTLFGLLEFLRMSDAGQKFQRFINSVKRDLDFVYDDLLMMIY